MSLLQFLGRGSAFAAEQNCAWFVQDEMLVLLDCPMSAFHRLKQTALLRQVREICVLVTHTHSDHVGGIPMLIHLARYVLGMPVRVIAPSAEVAADLRLLTDRLDGCDPAAYTVCTADAVCADWLIGAIQTEHVPTLAGRCFGWHLRVQDADVIYTGDTATLAPFLPLVHPGTHLYTEAAYAASGVHLQIDSILPQLLDFCTRGVQVYLMHLDDETAIAQRIAGTPVTLAPIVLPE